MKTIILALVISFISISCVQENIENPKVVENFYALSVGNSWVYRYYKLDVETNEYSLFANRTDSVSIIKKEIFNGETFYQFQTISTQVDGNNLPEFYGFHDGVFISTTYLRDSLGYLIYKSGNKKYWNNNFEESFVYAANNKDVYRRLNKDLSIIKVEAGEFKSYNMEFFTKDETTRETIISNFYYANGIGKVFERFGFIANGKTLYEKRLDSYIIE